MNRWKLNINIPLPQAVAAYLFSTIPGYDPTWAWVLFCVLWTLGSFGSSKD